jgi:hypothetical protein
MEGQEMTNFILGAMFTINLSLVGLIYASLSSKVTKLEDKTNLLEVLVSGKYMPREEAVASNNRVMDKLGEIQRDITSCMSKHRRHDDPPAS